MRMANLHMRSTAVAALLALPFATGAAVAQQAQGQQAQGTDQAQQPAQQSQDATQQQSTQQTQQQSAQTANTEQAAGEQQPDSVVATVGDAEIRGSDVMTVIGMLPPQLQSQPPQMLVPIALQQLILRELILAEARSQNLAQDPEVRSLVESSTQTAEEDAMVQVWLDREMANAVTDGAVQQVYEGLQTQGQQLPPMEQLRPQIEQHLRQQAMQDIQTRLQQGAEITLYDPAGQPIDPQQGGGMQQNQGAQGSGGNMTGNASGGQSGGETSGSPETAGEQNQNN